MGVETGSETGSVTKKGKQEEEERNFSDKP